MEKRDVVQTEAFFFKAMIEGYASGQRPAAVRGRPGLKEITFVDGEFMLVDQWCKGSRTNSSFGTTTIWRFGDPVWGMQYSGEYEESAILFLKQVLARTYLQRRFIGGRGEEVFLMDNLLYTNRMVHNTFISFDGREEIVDREAGRLLGYHDYRGMYIG